MQHIRKRLTVANDGWCNFKETAEIRVNKKLDDYIKLMKSKGWISDYRSMTSGNAMSRYELYISMYKLTSKDKREGKTAFIDNLIKINKSRSM